MVDSPMKAEYLIDHYDVQFHPAGAHLDITFLDGCHCHVHTLPNMTPETAFPFLIQSHVYKHEQVTSMYSEDLLADTAESIKPLVEEAAEQAAADGEPVAVVAPVPVQDNPNDFLGFKTNGDRG